MTKFSTAPHECVKLEDMKVNIAYAITISPEVQFVGYDRKTKSNSYTLPNNTFQKYVDNHLEHCRYSNYELYFELSPLGRQHYHGFLNVTDIEGFYSKDIQILKTLGTFCVKEMYKPKNGEVAKEGGDPKVNITGEEQWLAYCTKQQKILKNKYNINTNKNPKV